MQNTPKLYKLEGTVQHYAWGGCEFLPALLNISNADKKPFAEYWLGAHAAAPSKVLINDTSHQPLDRFIENDPATVLGKPVYDAFGQMPYLLKILDVKDMLSIQVHPSREAAQKEFEIENKKGIRITAPNRNYKDKNHKPELMLALGDFWLLHGFKSPALLKHTLNQVPELKFLLPYFENDNYRQLYGHIMEMDQLAVNERLLPLVNRLLAEYDNNVLARNDEDFWAARAFKTFCSPELIDRGIFSIYLFNIVHLKEGEAIFQDAGILHAYLEGQNVEIMSSSDNVLRGGLTNKHIDVAELMKHVIFEPVVPEIITGIPLDDSAEEIFPAPAADFELRQISLTEGEDETTKTHTAEIFFIHHGKVNVTCEKTSIIAGKGSALLAVAGSELNWNALAESVVFHATVPLPQA